MKTITLSLTDTEQNAFQQLLDIALRNNGMGAFSIVSHFLALINQATQQVNQATQQAVAAQAQVTTSAAPAGPVAQASNPAASQPQQPAQHGGGILGAIESTLGLGHEGGQHPANQNANQPRPAMVSTPAATPAPAVATTTPAAQTPPAQATRNAPTVS